MKKHYMHICIAGMLVFAGCKTSETTKDNNNNTVPVHHEETGHHKDDHASCMGKCGHTLTYVSVLQGEKTVCEVRCEHHVYGTDLIEAIPQEETWHCEICNQDETIHSEMTDTICHEYDF